MKQIPILTFILSLGCGAAFAGCDKADTCAAGLPKDAKRIYDKVKPKIVSGDRNGNSARFKSIVKGMVSKGELSVLSARGQAKKAGACISKAKS